MTSPTLPAPSVEDRVARARRALGLPDDAPAVPDPSSWPEVLQARWRAARRSSPPGSSPDLAAASRDDGGVVTLRVHDQFHQDELRDGCVAEASEVHAQPGGPVLGAASVVVFRVCDGRVRVEGTSRYPRHGLDLLAERTVAVDQLEQGISDVCREVHLLAGAEILAEVAARSLLRGSLRATRSGYEAAGEFTP